MKINKHKEKYYEKVVDWEKKPTFSCITLSIILFVWGVYGLISSYTIKLASSFNYFTFYIFSLVFVILGIFIFVESIGKGRKVKYRKLGK